MKTLAALLLVLALPMGGQTKKSPKMDEMLGQLQRATNAAEALPALTYILENAAAAPSLQLFIGSTAAMGNNRLEDAAFLFYAAQLRTRHDLMRFPPKASGGENPSALLAALNQEIGASINPAIMREPKSFAAVIKRVQAWSPSVPPGYDPGWPYTPGKPDAAKQLYATQLAAFTKQFGALAALLDDPRYFAAFRVVQDYNFSTAEEMQDPKRKKEKAAAEATMLEIERKRGFEGLYYKPPK